MTNKHSDVIDRSILRDPDIKKLEEQLGKPIASYPLLQLMKCYETNHKLEETVSVSSATIAVKVLTTLLDGARFFAERWKNAITINNMTEEKESIPITTEEDFIFYRGSNKPPLDSGGDVLTMDFDVSPDSKDRNMWVSFRKRDIEHKKYLSIENTLLKAGRRFARGVFDEISGFLVTNAVTTEALGANTRFIAITNLIAKLEEVGFDANAALMTPTDYTECLQSQIATSGALAFLDSTLRTGKTDTNTLKQVADYELLGYVPGMKYKQKDTTDGTLSGNLLIYNKESVIMGLYKDMTMVDWQDPIKWLQGFDLTATYDLKTHAKIDDGLGKVTGA